MATRKSVTKSPAAAPTARKRPAATPKTQAAQKASKATPPVAAPAQAAKSAKPIKPVKLALVRDSFTMPEPDFALIAQLKTRALGAKRTAKKSELLRAGLQALSALDAKALVAALDRLAPVKTGRPKKGH